MVKIPAKGSYSAILIRPLDGLHSVAAPVYLECGGKRGKRSATRFGSRDARFRHSQGAVAAALCPDLCPQVVLLDTGGALSAREDRYLAVPKGQARIAKRFNAG